MLAITEIRKLSHTLVSPSLGKNITLIQAIEELFEDLRVGASLELDLATSNDNEEDIDKNVNLMFYRILQEQLNNVIKHARASHVWVELVFFR